MSEQQAVTSFSPPRRLWIWGAIAALLAVTVLPRLLFINIRPFHNADKCGRGDVSSAIQHAGNLESVPVCLREWISRDKTQVEGLLRDRGFVPRSADTSVSSCEQPASIYISEYRDILRYLHHMPHFCEVYFNFYSVLNWQGLLLKERCIHSFMVDNTVASFWQKSAHDSDANWMRGLIETVDKQWGITSVTSQSCFVSREQNLIANNTSMRSPAPTNPTDRRVVSGALHGWFLHPVDAILLQAALLEENPCAPLRSVLTGPNVKVLILNRKNDRRLMHTDAIATYLQTKPFIKTVTQTTFDGSGGGVGVGVLRHQAKMLHDANVVIAPHGAGNTNIAFMRPCSVVIEIFPVLLWIPQYFGSLATQAGLLHFPVQATVNGSHFLGTPQLKCSKAFAAVKHLDTAGANTACFQDPVCRSCARGVDMIEVDLTTLSRLVDVALAQRSRCILESPYFAALK